MPRDQSECQVVAQLVLGAEQAPLGRQQQAIQGLCEGSIGSCLRAGLMVLTSQWPVLVVQGLRQVLNSEIMLVT